MNFNDINPLQAAVDAMSAKWQRERAATQMTLGKLIAALEAIPPDAQVTSLGHPHSYRGYYSDLAFEPQGAPIRADEFLAICKQCMGRIFEGYKGGDFVMGENTPVWIAEYGTTAGARKIIALRPDGTFETCDDE
ncbi:MAG: hypothetical protein GJU76_04175 [Gallionella sp.]|nr:hypothetical protein [Gallionella sp.]